MMRMIPFALALTLLGAHLTRAGEIDWKNLPVNRWVPIKPITVQPNDLAEKGRWINVNWNKIVYDVKNKRVLFNDRWVDKKHGGYTIYGNCVFSFEPGTRKLTPLRITNWVRRKGGRYKYHTAALPENKADPTPCDRHVYDAFDYAPELNSVFLCNGANRGAISNGKKGHGVCADTWRLNLTSGKWAKIESKAQPANRLEHGMAWCPDTKSIVYAGHKAIWILDIKAGEWQKAKQQLPIVHMGISVRYDAPRKRMLLIGGGLYGKQGKRGYGHERLYAFDPRTEKLTRLADCPTALNRAHLAHDTKRDLFLYAVNMREGSENPSGMFCYNPKRNEWTVVKPRNELPLGKRRGPMPMCYDAEHDCFLGFVPYNPNFYAFRFVPVPEEQTQAKAAAATQ